MKTKPALSPVSLFLLAGLINVFILKDYKMIIKLLGKFIYLLYREVMALKQNEISQKSSFVINREKAITQPELNVSE